MDSRDWESLMKGDVSESLLAPLHVLDIGRLHATTKSIGAAIARYFTVHNYRHARRLLASHVRQASQAADGRAVARYVGALDWLLKTANIPSHLMLQDGPALVTNPRIPQVMVQRLVKAGVRLDYKGLVSAARSQVEGIHSWVVAMMEQGIPTGMPARAEAVCWAAEGGEAAVAELEDLNPEAMTDLLYIALNTVSSKLAVKTNTTIKNLMCEPAAKHIDMETAIDLLKTAMEICSTNAVPSKPADSCIHDVLYLRIYTLTPWPADAVNEVLHLGLQLGVPAHSWRTLYRSTRGQLNSSQVEALLTAAVPATVKHWQQQSSGYPSYPRTYLNTVLKYTTDSLQITPRGVLNLYRAAVDALDSSTGPTTLFHELIGVCLPDRGVVSIEADNIFLSEASRSPAGRAVATATAAMSLVEAEELLKTAQNIISSRGVGKDAADSCLGGIAKLTSFIRDSKQPSIVHYLARMIPTQAAVPPIQMRSRQNSVQMPPRRIISARGKNNRNSSRGSNYNSFSCLAAEEEDHLGDDV